MPDHLSKQLFTAAWMSVAVGVLVEIVLLLLATIFKGGEPVGRIVADLVQKVSWSTLVCVGLALGLAASKQRPPIMGLLGLLAAPLAFTAAKSLHKSVEQAMNVAAVTTPGPTALQFAIVRALEYAALGMIVGHFSRKPPPLGTLRAHAAVGLAIGLIFGGVVLLLTVTNAKSTPTAYQLAARSLNEILFPLGCSIVLFAAHALRKRTDGAAPVQVA